MENSASGSLEGGHIEGNMNQWQHPEYSNPFPLKLYRLVEDSETNSLVSWNSTGTGFIIWDHNMFAAQILPRHFKTDNFSSFVYQLNNYGFKKINSEIYEYANPSFQLGKQDLLKTMKRRTRLAQIGQKSNSPSKASSSQVMETKIDEVMRKKHEMKMQIQTLKQRLNEMTNELPSFKPNNIVPDFKEFTGVILKQFEQFLMKKYNHSNDLQITQDSVCSVDYEMAKQEKSGDIVFFNSMLNDEDYNAWHKLNVGYGADQTAFFHNMIDAKAIAELDERMMESEFALKSENLIDHDKEDEGHLGLWT